MANLRSDPSPQPGQRPKDPAFKKKGVQRDASNVPDMDTDADTRQMGSEIKEDFSGGSEGDSVRDDDDLERDGNKDRRH